MIDFSESTIEKLIVHRVGNKSQNEGIIISEKFCDIYNELTENIMKKYLLEPFNKVNTLHKFSHESDIKFNEIYSYIKNIFTNKEENFYNESVNITKHLYEKSTHPNIKYGEVYIAYLKNCNIDNENVDAVGIFKSENKDVFIDVIQKANQININWKQGTNINKLDKGCVIFNKAPENGYKLVVIDKTNNKEAKYWEEDFLHIDLIQDSFVKTKEIVNICKQFTDDQYVDDKKEKALILGNTYDYLKENEHFETDNFVKTILDKDKDREKLKEYITDYSKEKLDVNNFEISGTAIKEVKSQINKSVIKLDKSIEIKMTDLTTEKSSLIEKGFDSEKQMYYYKIYFNEET